MEHLQFSQLPGDIINTIFEFIPPPEKFSARLVCKSWQHNLDQQLKKFESFVYLWNEIACQYSFTPKDVDLRPLYLNQNSNPQPCSPSSVTPNPSLEPTKEDITKNCTEVGVHSASANEIFEQMKKAIKWPFKPTDAIDFTLLADAFEWKESGPDGKSYVDRTCCAIPVLMPNGKTNFLVSRKLQWYYMEPDYPVHDYEYDPSMEVQPVVPFEETTIDSS